MTPADDRPPALALIDGEHYPPVVRAALDRLSGRYRFVAALFLGGQEKLRPGAGTPPEAEYGVPVVTADGAGMTGLPARVAGPPVAGAARRDRSAPCTWAPALGPGNELPAAADGARAAHRRRGRRRPQRRAGRRLSRTLPAGERRPGRGRPLHGRGLRARAPALRRAGDAGDRHHRYRQARRQDGGERLAWRATCGPPPARPAATS